jgi:hemoglobin
MRHAPFAVTPLARDRWLHHMLTAVEELGLAEEYEQPLRDYLIAAANSLVNTFDEPPRGTLPLTGPHTGAAHE